MATPTASGHAHRETAHDHGHDHAHRHTHGDGHVYAHAGTHHHGHGTAGTPRRALALALAITLSFAAVEAISGWIAGSLALMSDAGHMVTDSLSLAVALLAATIALRPPTDRMSYGYARIEVLAALFNAGFMVAVILMICWHAVERLRAPQPIDGATVIGIGALGLGANLLVAWILSRNGGHAHDLNTRGALLHVLGDALGSVAALASGLVILRTGWTPIDPLLSVGICALIAVSTWRLAREAVHTLMEGVPSGLSTPAIGLRMARTEGVLNVHDLHVWSVDSRHAALSAHVTVNSMREWPRILGELRNLLAHEFGIDHVTLQAESPEAARIPLAQIGRRNATRPH